MRIKDTVFDKNRLWFTSDTHFNHTNIIKYCSRPFDNAFQMNEALVENWNAKVRPGDTVFHLGDFSMGARGPKQIDELINNLNGVKYLIRGNHEKDSQSKEHIRALWKDIYDIAEIFVPDEEITYKEQHIVMCHYPMIAWNASHRGSWQLFGHVHGGLSNKGIIKHSATQLDVGVDSHEYSPISYQQVKELITQQALNK